MKKTISLALVFSFLMALAIQMPALAVDTSTSTPPVIPPTYVPPTTAPTSSPSYVPPVPTNYPVPTASTSSMRVYNPPTATSTAYTPERPASSTSEVKPILISYPEAPKSTSTEIRKPEPVRATNAEPVKIDTSKLDKNLEKIPSADYIKYFEKITKIDNTLYGVRKSPAVIAAISKGGSTTEVKKPEATSTIAKGLEKIAHPDQIKLYEKITKIGTALYGIKKQIGDAINNLKQDVKKISPAVLPTLSPELITCAGAAIDAKDSKISDAVTTAASDIASAISARGTCQKAALAQSSEQHGAINKCNQDFQAAAKTANEKARNAQKEIWTTYNNSLKTCSTTAKTSEIKIEDGGQNTTDTLVQ